MAEQKQIQKKISSALSSLTSEEKISFVMLLMLMPILYTVREKNIDSLKSSACD